MSLSTTAVFIDQTMLCEAARLLQGVPTGEAYLEYLSSFVIHWELCDHYDMGIERWLPSTPERLFHLATFLDAVTLFDSVYVLDAEAPPDAESLTFRQHCLDSGLVTTIDGSKYAHELHDELLHFLRSVQPGRPDATEDQSALASSISDIVRSELGEFAAASLDEQRDPVVRVRAGALARIIHEGADFSDSAGDRRVKPRCRGKRDKAEAGATRNLTRSA